MARDQCREEKDEDGRSGTQLFDSLLARGHIVMARQDLCLTDSGGDFAVDFGIDLAALRGTKAPLCLECLDWSERCSHLAGSLGRAFLGRFEERAWAKRDQKNPCRDFSQSGAKEFERLFDVR